MARRSTTLRAGHVRRDAGCVAGRRARSLPASAEDRAQGFQGAGQDGRRSLVRLEFPSDTPASEDRGNVDHCREPRRQSLDRDGEVAAQIGAAQGRVHLGQDENFRQRPSRNLVDVGADLAEDGFCRGTGRNAGWAARRLRPVCDRQIRLDPAGGAGGGRGDAGNVHRGAYPPGRQHHQPERDALRGRDHSAEELACRQCHWRSRRSEAVGAGVDRMGAEPDRPLRARPSLRARECARAVPAGLVQHAGQHRRHPRGAGA